MTSAIQGIARLGAVSIDCPDPAALSEFYQQVLGLEIAAKTDKFIALQGAGVWLTLQLVPDYTSPSWPEASVPKQMHLELAVSDLDGAEARILAGGATKAAHQPNPDHWRVLMDPVGHPFCITNLLPA